MVVNCLGVGWQDCQYMPPCILHPVVDFWMERKNDYHSHADFLLPLHELLSTHELQIRVLPVSGASTEKNGFVFPHAGPPLSVLFLAGSDCLLTHRLIGSFPFMRRLKVLTQKSGMSFPCILLLGASFPHAQSVWVVFPCERRTHCCCFGVVVLPAFLC